MTKFNINFKKNTIEMTKAVAQKASKYGSDEYYELIKVRGDFPTFEVKVVANPRRKTEFKGLNYAYMKKYIEKCQKDNKEEIMEKFINLTVKKDDCEVASYIEVKNWFLATFPEIVKSKENRRKEIDNILAEVA